MFKIMEYIDPVIVNTHEDLLFVYGDNLEKWGKAGQAVIRGLPNTFGVPTKRKPSNDDDAFFSDEDDEYTEARNALKFIYSEHLKGKTIVIPKNKLGSGLAQLETKSPKIWKMINDFYDYAEKNLLVEKQKAKKQEILVEPVAIKREYKFASILFSKDESNTYFNITNMKKLDDKLLLDLNKFANDRGGYLNYETGEIAINRVWKQKTAEDVFKQLGIEVYFETEQERLPLYQQKVLFGKYRDFTWGEVPTPYLEFMKLELTEQGKHYNLVNAELKRRNFDGNISHDEIISFGKFKGERWIDLKPEYLEWLSKTLDNDNVHKSMAQNVLEYQKFMEKAESEVVDSEFWDELKEELEDLKEKPLPQRKKKEDPVLTEVEYSDIKLNTPDIKRLAIVGSRDFDDYEYFKKVLNKIIKDSNNIVLISGGARGADRLTEEYAKEMGIKMKIHYADWDKHGKSAGFKRNEILWDDSDAGIAFWDGESKGTEHSFKIAQKQNKELLVVNYKTGNFYNIETEKDSVKAQNNEYVPKAKRKQR